MNTLEVWTTFNLLLGIVIGYYLRQRSDKEAKHNEKNHQHFDK